MTVYLGVDVGGAKKGYALCALEWNFAHDAPDDGRTSQPGAWTRGRQAQPGSAGPADSDNSTVPAS